MSLYFKLLIASVAVPLALSFDRRLQFWRKWNKILPAILIVALVYILFDIWLTEKGVWGFNPEYISGINYFGLPLEEILFFIVIPYASLFLHYSIAEYFPNLKLNFHWSKGLTYILMTASLILVLTNLHRMYTFYIFSTLFIVLLLSVFDKSGEISRFYITFLIILVPFLVVNGILTGTGIVNEVVWYNDSENLGIRLHTIPAEDFSYAFSMILLNLLIIKNL